MRTLVVDHHADVGAWIAAELAPHGIAVHVASDAAEALDRLAAFDPGVIFVEIALRGMNGWQLARHIRYLRGAGAPRLIAISALDQPAHREQSRLVGFERHLVKPLRSDELAAAVFRGAGAR